MKTRIALMALAVFSILPASCGVEADIRAATAQIEAFHTDINRGSCMPIYDRAAAAFRAATTEDDMAVFCNQIALQQGMAQSFKIERWNKELSADKLKTLTISAQTLYSKGPVSETFVLEITPNGLQLLDYQSAVDTPPEEPKPFPFAAPSSTTEA